MKRILFVDDESRILDGLRRSLHEDRKRWEMEFAVGGEAALKACEKAPFDIVISDMRMPGMDGATLLGHIRDQYPATARIVLSGHSEIKTATRAIPVAHRFLAKPCEVTEVRATIERVFTLQELLGSAELRRAVGAIGDLPSLSRVYSALLEAVRKPDISIGQIAAIIEQDAAMSAKVLQLANSAFFGLAHRVTSLVSAVSYLGVETIKNLALTAEVFSVFRPDPRLPQIWEALQEHAHRSAALAGKLPLDSSMREFAVVAALLHDVGELVLAARMPDTMLASLKRAQERGCAQYEAEEEILGTSHAEIGAYLLGLWGIPHLAVEAIAHHHRPARIPHTAFDISIAVYVADQLTPDKSTQDANAAESPIEEAFAAQREVFEKLAVWDRLTEFRQIARQLEEASRLTAEPQKQAAHN